MKIARHTLTALLLSLAGATSCGQIEAEPLLDEDGEPIPVPEPYEDWLRVVSVEPALDAQRIAPRPTFAVTFNQYLDDDSFRSYSAALLSSNGVRMGGSFTYIMTRKAIVWTASRELIEGFEYDFTLGLDTARSVTNSPRIPEDTVSGLFIVDAEQGQSYTLDLETAPVAWPEVRALFEARGCYGCHGDLERWPLLNTLEREDMIGARSDQVDRFIVRPLDPSDSYLMHKLLPDYPLRRFTVQPPPWAEDNAPLTEEEIWLVERWIMGGAKP